MKYFKKKVGNSYQLLAAETRNLYLISLVVGVVGFALISLTAIWEIVPSDQSESGSKISILQTVHAVLTVLGQTCLSASLITAIFNKFTSRQNATFVESIIGPAINEALVPSKELRSSSSDAEYRWFCYIKPCVDEELKDYLFQSLNISRIFRSAPNELHFYFAISSDDDCLSMFDEDESRVLSWEVPPLGKTNLKPNDPRVFSLELIEINGQKIELSNNGNPKVITVPEGEAVLYTAEVPKELRGSPVRISYAFHVLKPVGENWRAVDISSRFYKENEDIEFTLICAPELNVQGITPKIEVNEPRMLKNDDTLRRSSVFVNQANLHTSHVKLTFAGRGSSIHFEVLR